MPHPSREDLTRHWLNAPTPLPDDYRAPPFDPAAAIQAATDLEAADAKLPAVQRAHPCFRDFAIRPGMSAAEAVFWLRIAATTDFDWLREIRHAFHPEDALARYPEPSPSRGELERLVVDAVGLARDAVAVWLLPLIGLRQVIEWYLSDKLRELASQGRCMDFHVVEWHGHRFVSLVTRSEWRAALRALDEHLDVDDWFVENDVPWARRRVRPVWNLAVYLGHIEAVKRLVESWPDDVWRSPDWTVDDGAFFVLGARDPEFSLRHLPRLGLKLNNSMQTGIWLLQTGDRLLAPALEATRRTSCRDEAAACIGHLGAVGSDATVQAILKFADTPGWPQRHAREWLDLHRTEALPACARLATLSPRGDELAQDHLQRLWRGARRAEVEALADPVAHPPLAKIIESWRSDLAEEFSSTEWPIRPTLPNRCRALPEWIDSGRLPALRIGGRRLSDEALRELLGAARAAKENAAFFQWIRESVNPDAREKFWQALLAEWSLAGTGKKDDWCMDVVVNLRGPATATHLARLIGTWPAESQHHKAALGLSALRAMGDAPALQALVGIAQRTRFAGLRTRAETAVDEIAAELGLTPEELADTSVPACGLDQEGRLCLDFGPRRFTAEIISGGELRLLGQEDRVLKNLPKPAATDDPAIAAEATKIWKALKKSVADTVKLQTHRLETALITGRRWSGLGFERYIAAHPIMRHLARTLLWGEFDEEDRLLATFSLDAKGRAISVPGGDPFQPTPPRGIGLVHPLQMDKEATRAWTGWLANNSLESVFPQSTRETESPPVSHEEEVVDPDFTGKAVNGFTLRRRLESLGWQRGVPLDAGFFHEYSLVFKSASVTAILETSGQPIISSYDDGEVTVQRVFFVSGHYRPVAYASHPHALPLGLVDAVAYSETVRALRHAMRATAS